MKEKIQMPQKGERIVKKNNVLQVPNEPVIPYIEGDGIGPDIWRASVKVFNAAVDKAYNGSKKVHFYELLAGEKCKERHGEYLINDTYELIKYFHVCIKGPLTTPVGGGFRSLNVTLRKELDLYACIRPVKYMKSVPMPIKKSEKVDMIVFRENTEDVYAGIEWAAYSEEATKVNEFLSSKMNVNIPADSGIGIKPISEKRTKRLMRMAIKYAIDHNRDSITIVHKGNIMKYTEGAFKNWCYEVAKDEFSEHIVFENDMDNTNYAKNKIIIKDRIADAMFQQIILRPEEYSVLALPNLNGDYISDALAATIGGLGMAPGANIGEDCAIFEATHGTAPKYKDMDKVNPTSLILSGAMLFEYIGWNEVANRIRKGVEEAVISKHVTYDLARQIPNSKEVKCSEFADVIIAKM